MPRLHLLAALSILVAALVLALKYAAYAVTGSVALFSDALESIINLVTAFAAFYAIRVSDRPADPGHPYGHHKAEYFSAVLEGVLIVVAAGGILREAWLAFEAPRGLDAPAKGIAISMVATLVNAGWAALLLREGRRARSPALAADARHLFADVVTSVGVIAGLGLAVATGWTVLDPALAALVAVNILWSGWTLMRDSVGGLMDAAVPPETLERIRAIIASHGSGAMEAHDLRTRHAGRRTFIDFHLVVPGTMSVAAAHDICDAIEQALKAEVEGAQITIHVEPEEKAKLAGIVVL